MHALKAGAQEAEAWSEDEAPETETEVLKTPEGWWAVRACMAARIRLLARIQRQAYLARRGIRREPGGCQGPGLALA